MDGDIWHREECYQIQGVVFDVYREMGCGFLEAVYQECMEKELSKRKIPFVEHQELRFSIRVKSTGIKLPKSNRNASGFASQLWLLSESDSRTDCAMKLFRVFRGQCAMVQWSDYDRR